MLQPSELYLSSTLLLAQDLWGKLFKLNTDYACGFSKCAGFPSTLYIGNVITYWGKPVLYVIVDSINIMYIIRVIPILFLSHSLSFRYQNYERTAVLEFSY